jgi:hypothetical protein
MLIKSGSDILSAAELDVQPPWPVDTSVDLLCEIWVGDGWKVLDRVMLGAVTVQSPEGLDDATRPILPGGSFPDSSGSGHPLTLSFAPERFDTDDGETFLARLALQHSDDVIPGIELAS